MNTRLLYYLKQIFWAILLLTITGIPHFTHAQTPSEYYGYIEGVVYHKIDDKTRVVIPNATIHIPESNLTMHTDTNGLYIIGVPLQQPRGYITLFTEQAGIGTDTVEHIEIGAGFIRRYVILLEDGKNDRRVETDQENATRVPDLNAPLTYNKTTLSLTASPENATKNRLFSIYNPKPDQQDIIYTAWFFAEPEWQTDSGYGYGEGDHFGDDYYALDYNWGESGGADEGKTLFAPFQGEVIYVKDNYPICTRNVCWYGNQVVIRNGNIAIRYTHLKDVYVKKGQQVNMVDPIGTIGHSGLSGYCPYCAHLHAVLYKNLDKLSRRIDAGTGKQQTAGYWLERGGLPECMMYCYKPTQFAAKFELNKAITPSSGSLPLIDTAKNSGNFQIDTFFTPVPTKTALPKPTAEPEIGKQTEKVHTIFDYLQNLVKFIWGG
ncbi:MAG: M23 family metallopeptidase [bacterium]